MFVYKLFGIAILYVLYVLVTKKHDIPWHIFVIMGVIISTLVIVNWSVESLTNTGKDNNDNDGEKQWKHYLIT